MIRLSVTIATRNRAVNLRGTLAALAYQTLDKSAYEVIVSDDNSTDNTQEICFSYPHDNFKYVYSSVSKPHTWNASIPRNLGALVASKTSIAYVFVDSDVILPEHALATYLEDLEKNAKRVIIGAYNFYQEDNETIKPQNEYGDGDTRWQHIKDTEPDQVFNRVTDGLACFGGNLVIPKDIFWKVNGFDEDVHIGLEDGSMGLKLWKEGIDFSYDKRVVGKHQWHETPQDRFPSDMKKHIEALNMKHYGEPDPDYGIVEASRETYKQWAIDHWNPPQQWQQDQKHFVLGKNV